jgi:5-methylcytosine-specific restriction endonuclease McrA
MVRRKKRLKPSICEICGEKNTAVLHKHHIVERTDPNTNNDDMNLTIICSNCHNKVHAKQIKIIGLFPSTQLPYKRTLIYEENGVSNVPEITESYYKPKPESMKVFL